MRLSALTAGASVAAKEGGRSLPKVSLFRLKNTMATISNPSAAAEPTAIPTIAPVLRD